VLHIFRVLFLSQIIQVNLTQSNLVPIKDGKQLEFTYAVEWVETNTTFARRFDAYLDYPFFEHQVNPSCFIPLS
jgi:transmembrane 9 superfamily protein 3